jgi:MFS family permease
MPGMTDKAAPVNQAVASSVEPGSPLGNKQYRELWSANAASNFGGQVQVVGASWLMASLTASPQLIALVQGASSLGTVLVILFGGALADNYDRRRIMLFMQTAMLVSAAVLAALTWTGHISPWLLLALTLTISALGSINNPAWQASIRDLLPRAMISRAVALNSMSINLARTAGPALGGAIVALGGAAAAFALNALSFVGFLLALLRWRPARIERTTPRERLLPAMAAGVRYVALAPNVRNATVRGGLSGLAASAVFALLPVVARQEMQGNALVFGLLLAAFGFGAVFSAYAGGRLRSRFTPDQVVRIAAGGLILGPLLLALAPNVWIAGLGAALAGAGWTLTHSTYNTTVQLSASPWVTARSLATYQTATFAGMAAGSWLFGWVAEHHGTGTALLAASAGQVIAALAGLALPLPRLEDLQVDPLVGRRTPDLAEPVDPEAGPVRVEIEYRVMPENWPDFQAAMAARSRIRKRDGARNWALWQDLAERTRWIESYRVATWADYLRHIARRTEADRENHEALVAFDTSAGGPTARRYIGHID